MVPFLAATDIFFLRYHLRIRLSRRCCSERPGAVKGAPLLCAAQRTLDGEDRSELIAEEGKAGRKVGETWAAKMVPSPTASNICNCPSFVIVVVMAREWEREAHKIRDPISQMAKLSRDRGERRTISVC